MALIQLLFAYCQKRDPSSCKFHRSGSSA